MTKSVLLTLSQLCGKIDGVDLGKKALEVDAVELDMPVVQSKP